MGSSSNHHAQGQAFGIDQSVDLAPFHPLAGVITHCVCFTFRASPFSADLSDWLSMTPALGLASRPSRSRRAQFLPDRLPHVLPLESAEDVVRPSSAAGRPGVANSATGNRFAEDRRSRSSPSACRSCAAVHQASLAESAAPGAPIPDRSDRSVDNPQLGDTSAYQSPSTSRIILKIADHPVNHSFLNGTLPFETGSKRDRRAYLRAELGPPLPGDIPRS